MQTATLRADDAQAISRAGALLRRGQVVAFPTDTVYGVGAHALQAEAVARLYAAKGRSFTKAIPVLIADPEDVHRVARVVPPAAWRLAERFWPGGLTIVLPRCEQLPDLLTAGGDTVAIRYPDHPVPLALMRALGTPLAATSANLSGQPAPTTAQEVAQQLSGRLPLILDGGRCAVGVPSTLVDLSVSPPRLLRVGVITLEELRGILPELTV